jgi:type VI protein secretion system component VasK
MSQKNSCNSSNCCNTIGQTLLSLTIIILLGWQLSMSREVNETLTSAVEQRAVILDQATTNQTATSQQLESFLSELLDLSAKDPQAAAITQKYGIKRNAPTAKVAE